MIKKTGLLLYAFSFMILFSCKETPKNIKTSEITFTKEGTLSLFSLQDSVASKVKTLAIEFAENDYERETGLMHRQSMKDQQGMLFVFEDEKPQSFYMKNTLIPLDIIYIDKEFKIVSFQKNAEPLNEKSLPSLAPATYVLEINAGLSDQWNLAVGDSISFRKL